MKDYTVDMIKDLIVEDLIAVWNDFAHENSWYDDVVYDNDSYGYETVFCNDMQELARSIHFGSFDYMDKYFVLRNGNIYSFTYQMELLSIIDIDELVNWLNSDDVSNYSIEIMEGGEE